jgi:hypothetical protein
MALKVVGAGFGRTGTLSLKNALEKLGFSPCYHMMEVFQRPDHIAMWHRLAFGHPMDWDLIFRDFRATVLEALSFAANKHRHQVRKGSERIPHINHPIALAELLRSWGGLD